MTAMTVKGRVSAERWFSTNRFIFLAGALRLASLLGGGLGGGHRTRGEGERERTEEGQRGFSERREHRGGGG